MANQPIPEAAQQRVKQLYAAYALSRQDFTSFVTGLLLGMGLDPDDWELDINAMVLTPQQPGKVATNGLSLQR